MMSDLNKEKIPKEAIQALKVVEELLGSAIVGVYLFGSHQRTPSVIISSSKIWTWLHKPFLELA
ncbi:hypothetical protein GCM10008933_22860 [Paenibacillus motobuensis]|uniref:Uncharacterized protein n=1 Tax=Paenibacillus motobuensis TaxID=295324 RepID=A0ABP3I7E6_9BACL